MGGIPSSDHSSSVVDDETFGEDGQFKVHIKMYEGFDCSEKVMLREACLVWVTAWQSEEFKEWVLNFHFQDTRLTSEEIYAVLVRGVFESASVLNNGTDVKVWVGSHATATASNIHSSFHDGEQWRGSDYLGPYSTAKLADHLAYEYCRSMHFLQATATGENSVPFAVGKKTRRMADAASYSEAKSFYEVE
jgi:hypothetical protein